LVPAGGWLRKIYLKITPPSSFILIFFSFAFLLFFSTAYILVPAPAVPSKPANTHIYGDKNLGFFFTTDLQLDLPAAAPNSFPQKEYWLKDGTLWIYNASIRNRNEKKAADVDDLVKNFFFPNQFEDVQKNQSGSKEKESDITYSGKVKIHDKYYRVLMKYFLGNKYLHMIFIFYTEPMKEKASGILKSVNVNPNFNPF